MDVTRHHETDSLIRAFHESLIVHESADEPVRKVARLEALFTALGGTGEAERVLRPALAPREAELAALCAAGL
jgi:hypothetical protein